MNDLLEQAWAAVTFDPTGRQPGSFVPVTVSGQPGRLLSHLRVEDTAVACVGVALMAASALKGPNQTITELGVDRAHVAAAVTSERYFTRAGQHAGVGFAALSRFWRASDGWVRTHANYPWHKAALLEALGIGDDVDAFTSTLQAMPAETAETAIFAAGGVAAAVRSIDEWRSHPQGKALAAEPLVGHRAIGPAEPRRRSSGRLPIEGVRVLDLTRVIAGPVCTRYLGALGADVLRIDPPGRPDMTPGAPADTLLAKRSAGLDLRDQHGLFALHELLDKADVVVCGYRPGSLDPFGLGSDQLAERHRGLVAVYLSAWGHSGPWAQRRGFDSVVQGPTGIAIAESEDGTSPGALPCQLLDHGTGYLAAAAVLDGLRRQTEQGGTHIRQLSLARTAQWLTSTATVDVVSTELPNANDEAQWTTEFGHGQNLLRVVDPPGILNGDPLRWPGPPTKYGSDPPTWQTKQAAAPTSFRHVVERNNPTW